MKKRAKAGTSKEAASARRDRFIEAYIANGNNATQAAITAGFSPHSSERQGLRMTSDIRVKAKLYERKQELATRYELTTERVIQELARIALHDPAKLVDEAGNLKPLHLMDEDTRRAVASFKDGEVRMWSKVDALGKAMQHLRMMPSASVNVQANQAVSVAHAEVSALEPEQRSILEIGRRLAYALNMAAQA